jgi:hypothetical protein
LNQGKEQAMLLVHLVVSVFPETRFSRIPNPQEKYVVVHPLVFTITQSQSAGPDIATALEGRFVRYRGKQPQSDVVGESGVPEVSLA